MAEMLTKIKLSLRKSHSKLDEDIQADIDACLADLHSCGVVYASDDDPLIFNAVKLYCKSLDTDDPVKSVEWMRRYDALKGSLMKAEGYGYPKEEADE